MSVKGPMGRLPCPSSTSFANASTALCEVKMRPPYSHPTARPMRLPSSRLLKRAMPSASNWCCRTGTNTGSQARPSRAVEKSSSYASCGPDLVLRSRTGTLAVPAEVSPDMV